MRAFAGYFVCFALVVVIGTGCRRSASPPVSISGPQFVAFSLSEANLRASQSRYDATLRQLGHLGRVAGVVEDAVAGDLILVGLADPRLPEADLDDLVVALRARLAHDEWPLVSIDPATNTSQTRKQEVRFDGHLEQTAFGRDFLASDLALKLCCLGRTPTNSPVPPYHYFIEEDARRAAESAGAKVQRVTWRSASDGVRMTSEQQGLAVASEETLTTRFWFYALEPGIASADGVFCFKELRLALDSKEFSKASSAEHDARARFALVWSEHFADMCQPLPILKRLRQLYDLVAVAEVVRATGKSQLLSFLLEGHKLARVDMEMSPPLQELYGLVERADGVKQLIQISGGIQLRPEIQFLNYGDVSPLKQIVLQSRPSAHALCWRVPLVGWKAPNALDLLPAPSTAQTEPAAQGDSPPGCQISCQSFVVDSRHLPAVSPAQTFSGFQSPQVFPPMRGVSMKLAFGKDTFKPAAGAALDSLKNEAVKSRPASNALSWPMPRKAPDHASNPK